MELLLPTSLVSSPCPPAASFPSSLFSFLSFWDSPDVFFHPISKGKHGFGPQNVIFCFPNLALIYQRLSFQGLRKIDRKHLRVPYTSIAISLKLAYVCTIVSSSSHKPTWTGKGAFCLRDDLQSLMPGGDADAWWLTGEQHSHPEQHGTWPGLGQVAGQTEARGNVGGEHPGHRLRGGCVVPLTWMVLLLQSLNRGSGEGTLKVQIGISSLVEGILLEQIFLTMKESGKSLVSTFGHSFCGFEKLILETQEGDGYRKIQRLPEFAWFQHHLAWKWPQYWKHWDHQSPSPE